jgi:hypothetical protein
MKRFFGHAALVVATLAVGLARAEEVQVCFNYGCKDAAVVRFAPADLGEVKSLFVDVASPQAEREAIARAMGALYFHAALQTPTWRDRGGNVDDDGAEGRMDCIDHSLNTTAYLALLERNGWLRFHTVADRVTRGRFLAVHWGAQLSETAEAAQWVVDTWFLDPGNPATIYPLDEWLEGARPPGTELFRFWARF